MTTKHVGVFAFPFGSHSRSVLCLILKIANASPQVQFSFFNTATSNQSLFSSSEYSLPNNFKSYNLITNTHVQPRTPPEAVELFFSTAQDSFRQSIDMVVKETGLQFTCFLMDVFVMFAGEIAEQLNIPWVLIWIPLPSSLSAHYYTELIRKSGDQTQVLEEIPGLSMMKVQDLPPEILVSGEKEHILAKTLSTVSQYLPRATAVVMNFFEELNPQALNEDFSSKFKKVFNLGFFTSLPSPSPDFVDETGCLSWLDSQKPETVAYISFGTVVTLPKTELVELAEALESSGVPFLWSLKDHLKKSLPEGFVERTSDRGKIVAWTPQTYVLAHKSIGVFVNQSGTNSVCESIVSCVPMICRPYWADNHMTARMVEELWGIGVIVDGGVITKNGLISKLKKVLTGEEREKMKEKLVQLKALVANAAAPTGSANRDFQSLLEIIFST